MQGNIDIKINPDIIEELFKRPGEQAMGVLMNERALLVIKSNFAPDREKFGYSINTFTSKQPTYAYIWIVLSFYEKATRTRVIDIPFPIHLYDWNELEIARKIVEQNGLNLYFLNMDLVYLCGFAADLDIQEFAEKFYEMSMHVAGIPSRQRDYEAGCEAASAAIWKSVSFL